jgi:hypothetical protein
MSAIFTTIINWVKSNLYIAIGIGVALIAAIYFLFFKKSPRRRVRHHRPARVIYRRNRSLPRSVGMHRSRPRARRMKGAKKPWQIKGSLAAKRHMAQIRRRR